MNCKQGDLAIIVRSTQGNEGKIVRCLELVHTTFIRATNGRVYRYEGDGPRYVWRIDKPIKFGPPPGKVGEVVEVMYCTDSYMRPLRGDLTDDEVVDEKELAV